MTKKLFIFAVIMSGFSFVSMDGNCSEKYYSSSKMDNSEEENDNSISKEKDWGENPIFKVAKELGINVKDDNNVVKDGNEKDKQDFAASVDKIDYDNGYESPYENKEKKNQFLK